MEQLLGPLEYQVMSVLWDIHQGTVRDVLERLPEPRRHAYTTLMTVMVRLYQKGLLHREPRGNAFIYKPAFSKEGLVEAASRRAVREVLERFGEVAVAHFVEEAKLSPDLTHHLQEIIGETGGEGERDG